MTMTLIETKTLGTDAAGLAFTSIPQTYTDLMILFSVRTTRTSQIADLVALKINGATTNQAERELFGAGSGSASSSAATGAIYVYSNGPTSTSNTFSNSSIYFPNYTGATNKRVSIDSVFETNATTAYQAIISGLWSSTAAITSLEFYSYYSANLVTGTTASLYGILKGSDGIVTTS